MRTAGGNWEEGEPSGYPGQEGKPETAFSHGRQPMTMQSLQLHVSTTHV